jgi:DNA transformation protein
MTASIEFIELVKELLAPLGPIMVRRMFGGAGVYCDAVVFAFIDDDTLFLKTDEGARAAFESEGMGPFTYMTKDGPGTLMSYWRAPDRLLDEPDEIVLWARRALATARLQSRAKASKIKRAPGGAKPRSRTRVKRKSAAIKR